MTQQVDAIKFHPIDQNGVWSSRSTTKGVRKKLKLKLKLLNFKRLNCQPLKSQRAQLNGFVQIQKICKQLIS